MFQVVNPLLELYNFYECRCINYVPKTKTLLFGITISGTRKILFKEVKTTRFDIGPDNRNFLEELCEQKDFDTSNGTLSRRSFRETDEGVPRYFDTIPPISFIFLNGVSFTSKQGEELILLNDCGILEIANEVLLPMVLKAGNIIKLSESILEALTNVSSRKLAADDYLSNFTLSKVGYEYLRFIKKVVNE